MKIKNKGKVHPSPSSSSSSSNDMEVVVLSVLNLLPTAILTLASVLSLQDREVLAYMVTRSSLDSSSSSSSSSRKKTTTSSKKPRQTTSNGGGARAPNHHHRQHHGGGGGSKTPMFECECFDCYTSYWFRWDSSPNRDLIHHVIEAFEDHLTAKPNPRPSHGRGKKPRPALKPQSDVATVTSPASEIVEANITAEDDDEVDVVSNGGSDVARSDVVVAAKVDENDGAAVVVEEEEAESEGDDVAVVVRAMGATEQHKGLARKVLPDVLGLLNSRLWSLWSPNA